MDTVLEQEVEQELSKNDKFIVENYEILKPKDIREQLNLSLKAYRGRTSSLVRNGLIISKSSQKKTTTTKRKYTNANGVKKAFARTRMIKHIKESGKVGKVLTLPFKYCTFERKLLKEVSPKFTFVGCERDKEIFFMMLATVIHHKLKMECSPFEIGEKIATARENEFVHAILDYCGQLSSCYEDIRLTMERNIVVVGGTIAITLNNRKTVIGGIEDEMNRLNPIGNQEGYAVENAILTFLTKIGGFRYSIEEVMKYSDPKESGRGSNMLLVIVKRLK